MKTKTKTLPRGIRLNNPGNIEKNRIKWKGLAAKQDDTRFARFVAPEYGLRAMARILLGDWREGQNTLASLIHEWAPPSENPTENYVDFVAEKLGVDGYEAIDVPAYLPEIMAAMIQFENGIMPYSDDMIELGIEMERSV